MPTYDYKCKNCGYTFDAFQGMKDAPLVKCPSCSTDSLRRLVGTGAGIIFKGTGFYQTDYRSESSKKAEKKDTEASKPKESTNKTSDKFSTPKPANN